MAQNDADPASTATSQGQTIFGDSVVRVRAANLGVAVVRDLVKAIVTGTVAPGDILPPEGTLSQAVCRESHGDSRVREASRRKGPRDRQSGPRHGREPVESVERARS